MLSRARQLLLTCTLIVLALARPAHAECPTLPLRAVDCSFIPQIESLGGTFTDSAGQRDFLTILKSAGYNAVRLRVWNNPPDGWCSPAQTYALALRVKAAGMQLIIDFHYSDSWADPGQQNKPAAWASMNFGALRTAIRSFTAEVVGALKQQGTPPDIVQLGNEIGNGMLWNDGRVGWIYESNFPQLASLLQSAAAGVSDAMSPRPPIMIHLETGGDNARTRSWFDNAVLRGVPFDIIGLSYYPWWHGTLEQMRTNVRDAAARYGKPIFIAETAYPFTLGWNDNTGNFVGLQSQLLPGYPATPQGQADFTNAVAQIIADIPNGRGMGVAWWAPEFSAFPGLGSPWENLALVDFNHAALPALLTLGGGRSADFNSDGFLDFTDFDSFVVAFEAGEVGADFNNDAFLDFTDFDAFVSRFEAGCQPNSSAGSAKHGCPRRLRTLPSGSRCTP